MALDFIIHITMAKLMLVICFNNILGN